MEDRAFWCRSVWVSRCKWGAGCGARAAARPMASGCAAEQAPIRRVPPQPRPRARAHPRFVEPALLASGRSSAATALTTARHTWCPRRALRSVACCVALVSGSGTISLAQRF